MQRDDEIYIMVVSRSPHAALLLVFIGFLFFLHLLFSRHWTQSPILAWTRNVGLGSSWEQQQETRHARLARVCQENKGRTKQVVDPDRYFPFSFHFPSSEGFCTSQEAMSSGVMLPRLDLPPMSGFPHSRNKLTIIEEYNTTFLQVNIL